MNDAPPRTPADGGELVERMQWVGERGAIMDGERRYLMLRADVLMGLFHEMPAEMRRAALLALASSVRKHGGRSAQAYLEEAGSRPERLLDTIVRYSPQLGWGRWHVGARGGGAIDVTVENSPFAAGYGPSPEPVCYAIVGMLQAVGTFVLGRPASVVETCCAAQEGAHHCVFHVAPTSADAEARSAGEP
jgi:predicted hydrocarbon binding protein